VVGLVTLSDPCKPSCVVASPSAYFTTLNFA
jgi:hypothetical protein